jgi:hypothetical protein
MNDAKAIAVATAMWVPGIESKFARSAPVAVDALHVHLKKEEGLSEVIIAKLRGKSS